jgi:hypothetical protein
MSTRREREGKAHHFGAVQSYNGSEHVTADLVCHDKVMGDNSNSRATTIRIPDQRQ